MAQLNAVKENNKRQRYLSQLEIPLLLEHCRGYLKSIVIVAMFTGMRKGEILNLRWKPNANFPYVDFENEFICLPISQEFSTKNNEERTIPMSQEVIEAIRAIPKRRGKFVFENPKTRRPYRIIKRSFQTALKKAGIKDFKFHDLRHTAGSHLAMAGVDLLTEQEILGHRDPMTTRRYTHLNQKHKRLAIEKLSERLTANIES